MTEQNILKKICEKADGHSCTMGTLLVSLLDDVSIQVTSRNNLPEGLKVLKHKTLSNGESLTIVDNPVHSDGRESFYIRISPLYKAPECYRVEELEKK